ncbi:MULTISPECIES: glycerol kinase GlpK [Acinetobacter]|jgi:glycerol kinase|uniref:Glycerol kinase n=3 Tax=Acinetobacter TaxID=469 RepID=A0A0A8TPN9_ACIBZ|nr:MULTISPECIES: glycerol kinase GlpK [Acinetobacter]MEC8125623.1 glycerol kinase GlpK [Pseudomonadota bacterium]ENV91742.1 glycerol kinase [Acinetobacter bereziniae LMG 1003 = CIP 70.12]MBI0394417.1 glycerol kinase GlpK [Acinetobacter bereziniae]MBJ9371946.1 glycerol kinase GlpK [Acinetobacter sp. TGL-Y2]MBJ9906677.1 glycerol kinase GlpK [Acinetobacter bereziniae]
MSYLLSLDQGTTSSRAIIFDEHGKVYASAQREIQIKTPHSGWVEQDAMEIWTTQIAVVQQAIASARLLAKDIKALGLTNQRETTVVWDKRNGKPLAPAIVWQDRRATDWCNQLSQQNLSEKIHKKTGLRIDPYFSAGKLVWLLDNVEGLRQLAEQNHVAFGTIDSWLIWNLTQGSEHVIEASNASRTMLMDLKTQQWDQELLEIFNIPPSVLPQIIQSDCYIANTATGLLGAEIPICGVLGDQQSALFGQSCFEAGTAKNTYGTGCFMLFNTGNEIQYSQNKLLTTLAWNCQNHSNYALEGSVFMAGAIVQWLRDGLGIIKNSAEVEKLACQVNTTDGVVLVPAFTGLGAPHWDSDARALLCGMSRGTNKSHIARAALESIAFQVSDVLTAMQSDISQPLKELRVDGGASQNDMLMQFQADILNVPVLRPKLLESTAWGAAAMAGLKTNVFTNLNEISESWQLDRAFEPNMSNDQREYHLSLWNDALQRAKSS